MESPKPTQGFQMEISEVRVYFLASWCIDLEWNSQFKVILEYRDWGHRLGETRLNPLAFSSCHLDKTDCGI